MYPHIYSSKSVFCNGKLPYNSIQTRIFLRLQYKIFNIKWTMAFTEYVIQFCYGIFIPLLSQLNEWKQ